MQGIEQWNDFNVLKENKTGPGPRNLYSVEISFKNKVWWDFPASQKKEGGVFLSQANLYYKNMKGITLGWKWYNMEMWIYIKEWIVPEISEWRPSLQGKC